MKVYVSVVAALLLSISSVFSVSVADGVTPDIPDIPKRNTQPWVPARYKVVKERLLGKECGVLFVGDSITECWECDGKELWESIFLPMKAINFGVSGDRTESILWRIDDTKLAVKTPPHHCVLLVGTNNIDLWKGQQSAKDTVKGIKEVASRLLKRFPQAHLILMEVTPCGPDPNGLLRKRQEEVNTLLRRLILPRTTLLSINDRLLNPDGTFREGMFKDKVHLTAKGYQVWADALLPLLNKES